MRFVIVFIKQRMHARLLFDFGVVKFVNTTDDDCGQQIPTIALCLQQLTIPAV